MMRTFESNPTGAETGVFWDNKVNTIAVDNLALAISRPSAAMMLTVCNVNILVFIGSHFKKAAGFQWWEMIEN